MFDFDFDAMEPEPSADGSCQGSFAVSTPVSPAVGLANIGRRVRTGELDVEVLTLGGGVVGNLRLHSSMTADNVKARLAKVIGMRAVEQRLVIDAQVFDGEQLLQDVAPAAGRVRITAIHVPCARRVVVSGSRDGMLQLWDLDHGDTLRTLPGHSGGMTCVAARWASRQALSGGMDGLLRLWDLEKGRSVKEFHAHAPGVNCLAVDWASKRALSGGEDSALRLWDLDSGALVQEMLGHTGPVLCASLNWQANSALSGSADMSMRLWAIDTGEMHLQFFGHTPVNCLAAELQKQPNPIAVAGSFAILRFWTLTQFPFHWDLRVHTAAVTCLAVHWEWMAMVSGSSDTTLACGRMNLNSNNIEDLKILRGHTSGVTCLDVDWNRKQAISGSEDCALRLWDLEQGECLQELIGHKGGVLCAALELEDSEVRKNSAFSEEAMHQNTAQLAKPSLDVRTLAAVAGGRLRLQ